MPVHINELLNNPEVPAEVKAILRAAATAKPKRRTGFHIVGMTPTKGTEVEPGMRTFEDGTDRTYNKPR